MSNKFRERCLSCRLKASSCTSNCACAGFQGRKPPLPSFTWPRGPDPPLCSSCSLFLSKKWAFWVPSTPCRALYFTLLIVALELIFEVQMFWNSFIVSQAQRIWYCVHYTAPCPFKALFLFRYFIFWHCNSSLPPLFFLNKEIYWWIWPCPPKPVKLMYFVSTFQMCTKTKKIF